MAEDCGKGLAVGEMAKAADYFQAGGLFEHCVEQFKGGLRVGNVMERLVQAHDMKLEALEEAAMDFFKQNVLVFQVHSRCACSITFFLSVHNLQLGFSSANDCLARVQREAEASLALVQDQCLWLSITQAYSAALVAALAAGNMPACAAALPPHPSAGNPRP